MAAHTYYPPEMKGNLKKKEGGATPLGFPPTASCTIRFYILLYLASTTMLSSEDLR